MLEFHKAAFVALHFSYYSLMTFLMLPVILLICADDTTLKSKCDQASNLWQKLELASELESIYETLWSGAGSGLLNSMLEKIQLVSLDQSNNPGAINVKMVGLFLRKSLLLRSWG